MTPRRLEAIEEFLERLLQRSESPHPLEAEEVELVIASLRELLDEIVMLSVQVKELAAKRSVRTYQLERHKRALLQRCTDAIAHLERTGVEEALAILRGAFTFDFRIQRAERQFPYDEEQADE